MRDSPGCLANNSSAPSRNRSRTKRTITTAMARRTGPTNPSRHNPAHPERQGRVAMPKVPDRNSAVVAAHACRSKNGRSCGARSMKRDVRFTLLPATSSLRFLACAVISRQWLGRAPARRAVSGRPAWPLARSRAPRRARPGSWLRSGVPAAAPKYILPLSRNGAAP